MTTSRRRYKGRHRAPSTGAPTAARLAIMTSVAVGAPLALSGTAHADDIRWDRIVGCESGGRNVENAGPSTASGFFQIVDGTWRANGGTKYAARAIGATFAQQFEVAKRIAERRGSDADWEASSSCQRAGKKTANLAALGAGSAAPKQAAKAPAAKQAPVPKAATKQAAPKQAAPKAATPKAVKRAATSGLPAGYVVQAGDTLSELAQRYKIPGGYEAIADRNNIANVDLIIVGQVLR